MIITLFLILKTGTQNWTPYKTNLKLFSDEFATDKDRIIRWKAFLKKINWKEDIPFASVMQVIKTHLQPMAIRYWKEQ